MWQADEWLNQLYEDTCSTQRKQATALSRAERKAGLLQALEESIGTFERNESFEPKLLERVQCDGYVRERVELSAVPGLTFAAYVLIPDHILSQHQPGVLALHGHGYGSREIVGLLPDGSPDQAEPGIHRHFAVQLVKRGMVVIAPDVIGFGERRLEADLKNNPDAKNSCHRLSTQLMMLGKTLAGLRTAEALGAFRYLTERSEVDPNRLGIMGFSGGALIAYLAAALHERIQAAALIGFPNTFKDSILAVQHCIDNYIPGILRHAELPELIGLIAPRPLFLESGEHDPIFPKEGFERAVKQLQSIYEMEGASQHLHADLFPGRHEISGRQSFDWLYRTLAGI